MDVTRRLERLGCEEIPGRGGASHRKWRDSANDRNATAPDWGAKDPRLGTIRSTGNRWYKTLAARQWRQDSLLLLRAAGVRTLPAGAHWINLELTLHPIRLDVDAPLKLAIDTLAEALGIDDRWIGSRAPAFRPESATDSAMPLETRTLSVTLDGRRDRATFCRIWPA